MESLHYWLALSFSIALGLVLGSFINVVVARLPRGKSIIRPGSHCPRCKKAVLWYDNIPVLSYLLLRGKCRSCKKSISIRYPIIELLTGLLFAAVQVRFGWSPFLFVRDWPFILILMSIVFIDLEHRIIPDVLSIGGLVLGLATCWFEYGPGWISSISGACIGFGTFYSLAWIYYRVSGRHGLGGGDIKLLAMLGAFLGPPGVLMTVLVSSVFGSFVGIGWAVLTRKKDMMKVSIPYGPFLVIGALCYYLLGDEIWPRFMTPM